MSAPAGFLARLLARTHRQPGWWVLAAGGVAMVASVAIPGAVEVSDAAFGLQSLVVAVVAGLLLARRPGNRFGLLVALAFLAGAVASATFTYAAREPRLPGAATVAWVGTAWVGTTLLGLALVFLPLLFPDGRLPSRRWRSVVYCGLTGTGLTCAAVAVQPGELEGLPGLANPYPAPEPVVAAISIAGAALLVAAAVGAITSLAVRYRRGGAHQRIQVRWLAIVMGLLVIGIIVLNVLTGGNRAEHAILDAATGFLITAGLPLVGAVAILHDDLGALERLIRRSVVYAMLWLLVTSLVLSIPLGLGLAAGQRTPFTVAVLAAIVATLAVHPVRRRLLRLADRLADDAAGRAEAADRRAAQLSASRTRIARAALAERQRIQRDLHDGAQQELLALIAKLRLVRSRPELAGESLEQALAELQQDATAALTGLRELAHGIHPPLLTDRGLASALEDRVDRLPLPVSWEVADGIYDRRYPADVEAAAYFVTCEALANVLKHADARTVRVRLRECDRVLRVEVHDDGRGMGRAGAGPGGLAGLADRVEAVGGHLRTTSPPGGGTSVIAELPARDPEVDHG